MGNPPETGHHRHMNRPADKEHLDELLDAALDGTFPASDPTSSFTCDTEKPPLREAARPDLPGWTCPPNLPEAEGPSVTGSQ